MESPRKGDILLICNYNPISKYIRWLTKGRYNHVGIFVDSENVVESKYRGVELTPFQVFKDDQDVRKISEHKVVRVKNITTKQIEEVVNWTRERIGDCYDYWQLITLWFFLILKTARKIEPIDVRFRWLCSELVAEAFYQADINFNVNIDPDNITPADIEDSDLIEEVNG